MKAIQSIKAIQYRAYGAYAENRFVDLSAPAANDGQVFVTGPGFGVIADGTWGELVTQLARTLDARHAVSTTTSHAKAAEALRFLVEGCPFGRVLLTI
jgi:hypothetical protein